MVGAPLSLAACRAVIFASMVDDPSDCPDEFPAKDAQDAERERLHDIIRELVKWETTDETRPESRSLIALARYEIARSVARGKNETPPDANDPVAVLEYLDDKALPIYDPFAGGGSIPLETQRLGLRAIASDLNPVAVLINKALIEIPPKFAGEAARQPRRRSHGHEYRQDSRAGERTANAPKRSQMARRRPGSPTTSATTDAMDARNERSSANRTPLPEGETPRRAPKPPS